ncbi:MAG: hypothetical protein DRQ51_08680 [Gammaproteobacteria bacterium]|nr:MAG: hypothetical protein DRQ51_08680 [Gammaproteobacteria bacterium]
MKLNKIIMSIVAILTFGQLYAETNNASDQITINPPKPLTWNDNIYEAVKKLNHSKIFDRVVISRGKSKNFDKELKNGILPKGAINVHKKNENGNFMFDNEDLFFSELVKLRDKKLDTFAKFDENLNKTDIDTSNYFMDDIVIVAYPMQIINAKFIMSVWFTPKNAMLFQDKRSILNHQVLHQGVYYPLKIEIVTIYNGLVGEEKIKKLAKILYKKYGQLFYRNLNVDGDDGTADAAQRFIRGRHAYGKNDILEPHIRAFLAGDSYLHNSGVRRRDEGHFIDSFGNRVAVSWETVVGARIRYISDEVDRWKNIQIKRMKDYKKKQEAIRKAKQPNFKDNL